MLSVKLLMLLLLLVMLMMVMVVMVTVVVVLVVTISFAAEQRPQSLAESAVCSGTAHASALLRGPFETSRRREKAFFFSPSSIHFLKELKSVPLSVTHTHTGS